MLFCRCGCVTKPCSLCLAGLLATKLKSQFYNRVSEVTLGSFFVFFCYVWGHKAMQLVLGRLAFRHESRWCIAVADASQSHATCAWQARWPQNGNVNFIIVGFQK